MSLRVASLTHPFSPHGKISQVKVEKVKRKMQSIFIRWGMPRQIKIDNGRPFGDPLRQGLPPLALWLIGLGIGVIWNRPRTPQDNAKVERCQGTLGKWTEYEKLKSTEALQLALDRESNFYNQVFRDRRKNNTTRLERHPNLMHTRKLYCSGSFKESRVLSFVAKGCWMRQVSTNGQVSIAGERFSVGQALAGQIVKLNFDAEQKVWRVRNSSDKLVCLSSKKVWQRWIARIRGVT